MITLSGKLNRDLKRLYERRRQEAYQRRDARVRALYETYPELRELDRAVRLAGVRRLQADCRVYEESGGDRETAAREAAERDFRDAVARRDAFLQRHGIDDDYREPDYVCSVCRDTGKINGRPCDCRNRAVQSLMPRYFPDPMSADAHFSNFNLNLFDSRIPKSMEKVGASPRDVMAGYVKMATSYISNFDRLRDRNLFFSGAPGTGKTFLMQCIGHRLMEEGKAVIYVTAPTLFDTMMRYSRQQLSYRADPEQLEEATMRYEALLSWEVLLIDDLGTEPLTEESFAQLLTLLDTRLNRRLATVIASNLTVRDLSKKYDKRIASRIAGDYLTCYFPAGDLRLKKKNRIRGEQTDDNDISDGT